MRPPGSSCSILSMTREPGTGSAPSLPDGQRMGESGHRRFLKPVSQMSASDWLRTFPSLFEGRLGLEADFGCADRQTSAHFGSRRSTAAQRLRPVTKSFKLGVWFAVWEFSLNCSTALDLRRHEKFIWH